MVRVRWGRLCAVATLVAGLQGCSSAPPGGGAVFPELPVHRIELANGLRVVLLPRATSPTVSFVMRFDVGAIHEADGQTGIAHVLEHMLFKGTESIGTTDIDEERRLFAQIDAVHDSLLTAREALDPTTASRHAMRISELEDSARTFVIPNEYDRILSEAGAQGLNATTTHEATTYFVALPANRTELFFALEADRMSHPVFREFYSELDVVMEERRLRVETSPGGTLYERHLAEVFTHHPYGRPVVGTMEDLQSLSRPAVADFYRRHYTPDRAVLAVVGDFNVDQVDGWVRQYLGPIPPGSIPNEEITEEPAQLGERRLEVDFDAEPLLRIGWRVPSTLHPDAPALAVLGSLLTGGRTSRLHQRLVTKERAVTAVFAQSGPGSRYPGVFQIDATPTAGSDPRDIERAIYEEISRIVADGVSEEEVQRIRNQVVAGRIRRLESDLGLAFQLAESEVLFGDWRETFSTAALFEAVTVEDVRRVAEEYLIADTRSVAVLRRSSPD